MAITIVTTAGAANANSYITSAYADSYAETTQWAATWAALSTEAAKAPYIVRAARALDYLAYAGTATDETVQALQWPRSGVLSPNGLQYDTAVIPEQIKKAQAHIAAWLATQPTVDPFSVDDTGKIESLSVGSIALRFRQSVGSDGGTFLGTSIAPMLRPWGFIAPVGRVRLTR